MASSSPVRRSALAAVRATSSPRSAGLPGPAVELAEVGPIDVLEVIGGQVRTALAQAGLDLEVGKVITARQVDRAGWATWGLAEEQALLVADASAGPSTRELAERLRAARALVTDLSSAFTMLRLAGPGMWALLEEACAVDVSARSVPAGGIVQAPLVGVRAVIARGSADDPVSITCLVARDVAEYAWTALLELGAPHGLVSAGVA